MTIFRITTAATVFLLMLGVWLVLHQGHATFAVFLGFIVGFGAGWFEATDRR